MKVLAFLLLIFLAASSQASAYTLAQFRTRFGDIDVELYDQDKPVTVQNFIRYVKSGAYQNMFLHRCLPGFVAQGGGFSIGNPAATNAFNPTNGNIFSVPIFGAITNEFNVGRRLTTYF